MLPKFPFFDCGSVDRDIFALESGDVVGIPGFHEASFVTESGVEMAGMFISTGALEDP